MKNKIINGLIGLFVIAGIGLVINMAFNPSSKAEKNYQQIVITTNPNSSQVDHIFYAECGNNLEIEVDTSYQLEKDSIIPFGPIKKNGKTLPDIIFIAEKGSTVHENRKMNQTLFTVYQKN